MAEKSPVEVHRLMLRGRIAFERGQYAEALEQLGKAALQWPDNAPIRFYRARAAEGVGDFDLAVEEYRQAIRSDSRLTEARERLAKLHLAEGDFREAAAILTFQSPRDPSTPSAGMRILMVEVDTIRGAEPDLEIPPDQDYSLESVRAETIRSIGSGLRKRANAKIAAGVLAELEKSSAPAHRGAFLRERVELMAAAGHLESAVSEARKGLKARPEDPDTQLALGHALVASGLELEEADRLLRGVVARRPADVDGWTFLGDLETRRGNLAAASESYERALKLEPAHWSALAPRLVSISAAGESDEAIRRLEVFVASTAPYDGRAALELARRLPTSDETRERRIQLAEQAIRFGAGREAVELLAELDPAAAVKYLPDASTATDPSVSATESAQEKSAALKKDAATRVVE
jgi:tetratricopeptide (TPR) repeat protein